MTAVHLSSGWVLLAEDEAEEAAGSLTVEFARSAKQATTTARGRSWISPRPMIWTSVMDAGREVAATARFA